VIFLVIDVFLIGLNRFVNEQFTDAILPKKAPGILIKLGNSRISPDYLLHIIVIEYHPQLGING
jgi:hypothetical protein